MSALKREGYYSCYCGAVDCNNCYPGNRYANPCICDDVERIDEHGALEAGTCTRCGSDSEACDFCGLAFFADYLTQANNDRQACEPCLEAGKAEKGNQTHDRN